MISPAVGISNPAMSRRMVVFPHPDGPTSTTNSPSFTSKEISCTTLVGPKLF